MTPVSVIDLQEREQYILKVQLTHKSPKVESSRKSFKYALFNFIVQGAAFAMKHSREDTSYFDLISSGKAVIRRIGVGAENVDVT